MDFDCKFQQIHNKMDALTSDIESLAKSYAEARAFTENFLDCCKRNGVSTVAIMASTDLIPKSKTFSFGVTDSVFATERDKSGFPAIWRICTTCGVHGGCGNTDQAQLNSKGQAYLINGVYTLKDGVWSRQE